MGITDCWSAVDNRVVSNVAVPVWHRLLGLGSTVVGAARAAVRRPKRWLVRRRVTGELLSRRGVERSAVAAVAGLRAMNLVQSTLALAAAQIGSVRLDWAVGALLGLTASGLLVAVSGWRRQQLVGWAVTVDVCLALAVLVAAPLFQPAGRAWMEWPIWITFLVAAEAAVVYRPLQAATLTLALMAAELSWLLWDPPARSRAAVGNYLVPYVGFALVAGGFVWYMRRLASLADLRADTIQQLEEERTRRLLHTPYRLLNDLASMLRRESGEAGDAPERAARLAEAVASLHEIESVVRGTEPASGNLAADLLRLREQFVDLPLMMNVEDAGLSLPPATVYRIREAVRSALQNVRLHAEAGSVVVYASTGQSGWFVSVCDDGRGYDPDARQGVGVRDLMFGALEEIDARVTIDTAPGQGTLVEFKGVM